MGYTLELWDLRVAALLHELRRPTLRPDHAYIPGGEHIVEGWESLAATVASALERGGDEIDDDPALYVVAVVRMLGEPLASLDHTSSGGDEFRGLLYGAGARRMGPAFVDHLLARPLGGLSWAEYPSIGWVSASEVREASARLPPGRANDGDPFDVLWNVEHTVRTAGASGREIVSLYL